MLTSGDDFLFHQTADPIAFTSTSDRNFYDRYFFNGFSRDGSIFFAVALGLYPNRFIMDGAFNVVHKGRQYVVRASRRAPQDRMETTVGPIAVRVIEPLKKLHVVIRPNPHGISGDLIFTARAPALEEPRFHRRAGTRLVFDYTRLTQHVTVEGTVQVGDETIRVSPDRFWGMRDRSWGVRPIGEPETGAPGGPAQFFWLWSPMHFDDMCTHFDVNEDAEGAQWHSAGMIVPDGGPVEYAASVAHRLEFQPQTRHAKRAEIVLRRSSGEEVHLELKPLYNFYMIGLGYLHPQWGHGMYVGENEMGGESWTIADVNQSVPLYLHVEAVCEATMGKRRGIGVLEQAIIGPHKPYGFKELFDLAP